MCISIDRLYISWSTQWGIFPMADNYASDDYYYLISIHTGMRKSAGTRSKVKICLDGEFDATGVRDLSDGVRNVSQFLMFNGFLYSQ